MKAWLVVLSATVAFCAVPELPELRDAKDPAEVAATWIRMADPLHNAWAIYLIRCEKLTGLVPAVEQLILQPPGLSDDFDDVQYAALDALVQLDCVIPVAELAPFAARYPTLAMILASRATEDNTPLLLDLLGRAAGYEAYIAVGNLLAAQRSPAFAKHLMTSLTIHVLAAITDPGSDDNYGEGSGGGLGSAISDPGKSGWPPVGNYFLTDTPGAALLASGRHSIFYSRSESRRYIDQGFQSSSEENSERNRNLRNQEYLADLLHSEPKAFPLQVFVTCTLIWSNANALAAALGQALEGQRTLYREAAGRLVAEKLLTAGDASTLQPHITLNVMDVRTNRQDPLPNLPVLARELAVTLAP